MVEVRVEDEADCLVFNNVGGEFAMRPQKCPHRLLHLSNVLFSLFNLRVFEEPTETIKQLFAHMVRHLIQFLFVVKQGASAPQLRLFNLALI